MRKPLTQEEQNRSERVNVERIFLFHLLLSGLSTLELSQVAEDIDLSPVDHVPNVMTR